MPAYCVLARWHAIEREQRVLEGSLDAAVVAGVVYVERPPGVGSPLEFDDFRGDADLMYAEATLDPGGALSLGPVRSLLGGCGIDPGADVRTPAVSWDGERVAFAARPRASDPLRLYWMNADGTVCEPVPDVAVGVPEENGILTHDFDPAFAPDGRLVFASTRGNLDRDRFPYQGPTRTPAAMTPNANLYVLEAGGVRQLTYLLNQEVSPAFMNDGRLIMSAEKREPEFHMVATRRQNLDGGDYHPLFAQRESLGFRAGYEVVELLNRNFAFVSTTLEATDGAGAIGIVNRSIGPDEEGRDPNDRFYLSAFDIPVPGAFGGGTGVYRSPSPLPTGRVLTSCDLSAASVEAGPFEWGLCELDPRNGQVRELGGGGVGRVAVEAAAVFAREAHPIFVSRTDEPNGATHIEEGETDAVVHVHDLGLLATLLFDNTRNGRPLDPRVAGLTVFEALPPPASATSFGDVMGSVVTDEFGMVYVDYQELGSGRTLSDGSIRFRVPGGAPILLQVDDADGEALRFEEGHPLFTGPLRQREQLQFYPGERNNQSFPRRLFNGICGQCHGSISGRELDVAVDVDVLSGASRTLAWDENPANFMR